MMEQPVRQNIRHLVTVFDVSVDEKQTCLVFDFLINPIGFGNTGTISETRVELMDKFSLFDNFANFGWATENNEMTEIFPMSPYFTFGNNQKQKFFVSTS